jgi:hypothetical protein
METAWLTGRLHVKSVLPFSKKPEPMVDLDRDIQGRRRDSFDHWQGPRSIRLRYEDLEDTVWEAGCRPDISPDTKNDLEERSADLSKRWVMWRRLEMTKCVDQATCFANYHSEVLKSIDDAQGMTGLDDPQKSIITDARQKIGLPTPTTSRCGTVESLLGKSCYDVDEYERDLLALADIDDAIRQLVATHALHEKLDPAILTTQDVDPGTMKPGSTLKSPNNTYFAIMHDDCNFQIYKGHYTTAMKLPAQKYVVAQTVTASTELEKHSNCHLDLQRDGNIVVYADVTLKSFGTIVNPHQALWVSHTSNGGNADYWLMLLDNGTVELRAGTPFSDGGVLFVSKLVFNKAFGFVTPSK